MPKSSGPSSFGESSSSESSSGKTKYPIVSLARYSAIGFTIPSAIVLGLVLGWLLDYWLHTKWLYLGGLLFGAVVGFSQMIRLALSASDSADSRSSHPRSAGSADRPSQSDSGSTQTTDANDQK